MMTKSSEEKRRGEKKRHIEKKRIEHMLMHFLYVVYICTSYSFLFSLIFQGALTHATIHRGLTIKYKLECVGKRKKINSVNCHYFHMIKSIANTNKIDNEIKA